MSKFIVITKKQIILTLALTLVAAAAWVYYAVNDAEGADQPVLSNQESKSKERVVHMVAGEFSSTTVDGQKLEAYLWHPGVIPVKKGEQIKLVIRGINGESHPFVIEGTDIKGEVKKGKETVVNFSAKEEGVYRLICLAHAEASTNGPMIAYIVVD